MRRVRDSRRGFILGGLNLRLVFGIGIGVVSCGVWGWADFVDFTSFLFGG